MTYHVPAARLCHDSNRALHEACKAMLRAGVMERRETDEALAGDVAQRTGLDVELLLDNAQHIRRVMRWFAGKYFIAARADAALFSGGQA